MSTGKINIFFRLVEASWERNALVLNNLLQVQEINDKLDIDSVAEQKVSSEEKSRSGWYQVSREHLATSLWSSLKFSIVVN